MKWLNARVYIAFGLASLCSTIVLVASVLHLFPDRDGAIRSGRAAFAETLAFGITGSIAADDVEKMEPQLKFAASRNTDMLSAAVRKGDGTALVTVGEHDKYWQAMNGARSTDAQIEVPIMSGRDRWGALELRFEPITPSGLAGLVHNPLLRFALFVAAASFIAFYFYLGRVLSQLDPSRAIPPRVRAALDTLAEGLLVIDRRQQIVLANEAMAHVLGAKPETLIGTPISRLEWQRADSSSAEAHSEPWLRAMESGAPQTNETLALLDAQGDRRTFIVNCAPVLGARGRAAGVVVSLEDVTQLERNKVELGEAKARAEAANQAKSDFLANMSHDIRTPMNAILGFTELLKRGYGRNAADAKKYLQTIHTSGKHLLEIINDILDLSKIEAGRLEVEKLACSPLAIVNEVVTVLSVRANEKGIALTFRPHAPIPATIVSDPTCLRRIVTNLVGNALKFTEKGGVTVVLRLAAESTLAVDVIDTGIGISADRLESMFDPFVQADSSVTRRFGGTGLGLTISRRFARALGGDITVASEIGKGSTFTVTLATGSLTGIAMLDAASVDSGVQEEAASAATWRFPAARVLVVDDGPENRELLRLVLEEVGLQVEEAENGSVAVEKIRAARFDAVLMDMQMPVMDGYTATRAMRAAGVRVPIFALTANAMKGVEKDVVDAGCSGYLVKPVDIDQLLETLAALLGGTRSEGEAGAAAAQPASVPETAMEPVRSRLASNPRLVPAIRKFAVRLESQMQVFEQAFAARQFDELAKLGHWLKGAGGTVGYDAFTEPAARLEDAAKHGNATELEAALQELRDCAARLELPPEDAPRPGGDHTITKKELS